MRRVDGMITLTRNLKNRAVAMMTGAAVVSGIASAAMAPAAHAAASVAPPVASATAPVTPHASSPAPPAPAPRVVDHPASTNNSPPPPYAGISDGQDVKPVGVQGAQSYIQLSPQQWSNAKTIVERAQSMHLPAYAAVIAVATSLQESKLVNLQTAVDHDSIGLFQQRPSTGWGSPSQVGNPWYAAGAFLNALQQKGFQGQPLSQAAQDVQGSAFPMAYAQWQNEASSIVVHLSHGDH